MLTFQGEASSIRMGPEEGQVERGKTCRFFYRGDQVFADPLARIFEDPSHSESERREIVIGHSKERRLILVSFTETENNIRLLSARKATRMERKDYEENVKS